MKYICHEKQYTNGLSLILKQTPDRFGASLKIQMAVGSEDETDEFGLSHLLEHELFKGTSEYNQEELSGAFMMESSAPDASTSSEFTVFKSTFPKTKLEKNFELWSKMFFDSTFEEKALEAEKRVVLEEIKMHLDDPTSLVFDNLIANCYKGVGIANRIAGDPKLLKKVTREDLIAYKNAHYTASNCTIAVVGDYAFDEVKALAEKYFVNQFGAKKHKRKEFSKNMELLPAKVFAKKDIEQANICIGLNAPKYNTIERFAYGIISAILGGSMNSRLFCTLRNKLSLCYNIFSEEVTYINNGISVIDFATTNEFAEKATKAVFDVINEVLTSGVTDAEFVAVKNMLINRMKMAEDNPTIHAKYHFITGKIIDMNELIDQIAALTKEKCEDVYRKYAKLSKACVSYVGNKSKMNLDFINEYKN